MGFDLALNMLQAGCPMARKGWQELLVFEGARIWRVPAVGTAQLWTPTQEDLLAKDWVRQGDWRRVYGTDMVSA